MLRRSPQPNFRSPTKIIVGALVFLTVGVVVPSLAHGQIFIEQGEDVGAKMKQELEEQKNIAERRMQLIVREMERASDLSEHQVKQLRVAIKGTVNKFLNAKAEERRKQWEALGIAPPEDDDEGDDTDADSDPNTTNQIMIGAFGQSYDSYPRVEESKVWLNTVNKVLTEEQLDLYERAVAQRNSASRHSAVDRFIANADRKLVLSPNQRNQLFELVDEHFGEKLARSELKGMDMMEVNMFMGLGERHNVKMPIDRDLVEKILDEVQMEEWKHSFELQLNQLPDH